MSKEFIWKIIYPCGEYEFWVDTLKNLTADFKAFEKRTGLKLTVKNIIVNGRIN